MTDSKVCWESIWPDYLKKNFKKCNYNIGEVQKRKIDVPSCATKAVDVTAPVPAPCFWRARSVQLLLELHPTRSKEL